MMIYLKHPIHGVKIASLEAEAKFDESKGWTRFDPSAPVSPSPDPAAVDRVAPSDAELDAPTTLTLKRKPGRPRKALQ